jgi:hypothetical protein
LGVPIEHLVYVGDNNGDFIATADIGIDFIEARLFSNDVFDSIGKNSLIFESDEEQLHFENWSDFPKKLVEIEQRKLERHHEFAAIKDRKNKLTF